MIACRLQVGNHVVNAQGGPAGKDTDDVIPIHGFAIDHNPPLTLHETSTSVAIQRGVVHINLRAACPWTASFYNFMNYLTMSLDCNPRGDVRCLGWLGPVLGRVWMTSSKPSVQDLVGLSGCHMASSSSKLEPTDLSSRNDSWDTWQEDGGAQPCSACRSRTCYRYFLAKLTVSAGWQST